jgi:transcriptional regulator with XRE-family HTH domain
MGNKQAMKMDDNQIGLALRQARRKAGLNQQAVAASLGVSQAFVSKVERGGAAVPSALLPKLSSWGVDDKLEQKIYAAITAKQPLGITKEQLLLILKLVQSEEFVAAAQTMAKVLNREPNDVLVDVIFDKLQLADKPASN